MSDVINSSRRSFLGKAILAVAAAELAMTALPVHRLPR
jgi:hypothetical protein